jgi:PAS domain S-box-containing protein
MVPADPAEVPMFDWFRSLVDTTGYVPRKQCGGWTSDWIATHTGADLAIWLAYVSIPLVLLTVTRHPAVRQIRPLVWLFAAFIVACGSTHLIEAVLFEYPVYRLSGVMKVVTAVVSWATVFALVPAVPKLLPVLDQYSATAPTADPDADKPPTLVYSLAVLVALLATLIRFLFDPLLGDLPALGINVLAVIFVAWYGGFGPGLITLVMSGVLSVYLFVPPRRALWVEGLNFQVDLGLYLITGLGVLVLGELQRTTRNRLRGKVAQLRAASDALTAEKQKADETLGRLDAFLRHAPGGIAMLDADLRFVWVNEMFAAANGEPIAEHIGRSLQDVLPDVTDSLAADYRAVVATGAPMINQLVYGRTLIWQMNAFRVPLGDGRSGLGIIGVDVTEQRRQEEQVRESEGRFRQLAEAMPQIVWMTRPDGYHEYYNTRWYEYTGLTSEQSIGWGWSDPLHPDDRERSKARWQMSTDTGSDYEIEYRFRRHDGSYQWFLGRASAVRDEGGRIVRWLGTCTDIDEQVRTAQELAESRRFSESVLHSLPSHLAVIEADGRILAVNESWRQFAAANGIPPDRDWTTANYFDASRNDEYGRRAVDGIRAVARGDRGAFEMEYPCHGNGQERYFLLRANRFRGDGPVRLVITHENVTDRVLAERKLRESASQLTQLTEGVPLLMWACRPSGECDYLSRQWLEYTGGTLDGQLGFGWLDALHPDDRAGTATAWQSAVEGRGEYDVEYRIRRHDGAYHWFAVRGIPLRDHTGAVVRWFGSCTDIDDRKHYRDTLERLVAERTTKLREQQIFTNAILDTVSEGIAACDADGNLRLFNAATRRMHGLPAELLPFDRWAAHYRLYEADGVSPLPTDRVPLLRAWRGEAVRDAEMVIRAAGQPDRYVVCSGAQLKAADGTVSGAVVSMRDMTDRREYERQLVRTSAALRASNEELEKFAYAASHDLQEPLRKIQAFGTRLADRYRDAVGDQGKDYIDRMLDSAGRMRKLIDDLLALSRVSSKPLAAGPVALSGVVDGVLANLEVLIQKSGGRVEVGPLPVLDGDDTQFGIVFQNLIANAVKFARPGVPPVVRVSASPFDQIPADADPPPPPTGPGWRITVADNGIGFAPEYGERIFGLFQRLHTRAQYEGTGLGLAIVRKIVVRHGASIVARGRPDEGATFVIDWPTTAAPAM